jgi:hypothetical protein
MFNRRGIALVVAGGCLLLASGAAAAEPNEFSATSAPTHVQPQTPVTYTIRLTNSAASEKEADRAKIGIPPDFVVDPGTVQATTNAVGACVVSSWGADGTLIADGKINLKGPDKNPEGRLCQGASLTVVFSATSPATDATYTWVTELFRDKTPYFITSPQPTVQVDGTPPTVTIGQKPNNPSNSRSATFTFSASEPTTCKLDEGAFTPCTSLANYSGLTDGPHTFTVLSTDAAGNTAQDSYTWTVETRAPTAAVSSGPGALTNSRSATFAFSADEPSSFQCQLDGGSFLPCSSPTSYQGLGDGAHTFAVRPTDAVGNTGATASYSWRIDATAPETTISSGPLARTTTLSATFRFSASEPAAFQCKLDAGAFVACTSPKTYAGLRRTAHSFEARAIDAAGNVDPTSAVRRWTIVAAARTVTATSALFAPRTGARVTSPPVLRWRRVAKASYYNVQLYRGRVKVLSTWPTRTSLQLRVRWTYLGRQQRLSRGTYRWYVWPGYGRPAARRYGRLLGQSTFTMAAPPRR